MCCIWMFCIFFTDSARWRIAFRMVQISGRKIRQFFWECNRQSSCWIHVSRQHIHCSQCTFLSGKPHFQNTFYLISPRHCNRVTIVKDHNYIFIFLCNPFDQFILIFFQFQSVIHTLMPCKTKNYICLFCFPLCLLHSLFHHRRSCPCQPNFQRIQINTRMIEINLIFFSCFQPDCSTRIIPSIFAGYNFGKRIHHTICGNTDAHTYSGKCFCIFAFPDIQIS